MLMCIHGGFRVASSFLTKVVVPLLDKQMVIEREKTLSRDCFASASAAVEISHEITKIYQKYTADVQMYRGTVFSKQPNYEGRGYGSNGFDELASVYDSSGDSKGDMTRESAMMDLD